MYRLFMKYGTIPRCWLLMVLAFALFAPAPMTADDDDPGLSDTIVVSVSGGIEAKATTATTTEIPETPTRTQHDVKSAQAVAPTAGHTLTQVNAPLRT
jgi:hypothetical protein